MSSEGASGGLWLRDFRIERGGFRVKKTGALVPLTSGVVQETASWLRFFASVQARRARGRTGPAFTVHFTPDEPRPWYLIWPALRLAGARFVRDPARADVAMQFEDATRSLHAPPAGLKPGARLVNFGCADVSKSAVARAQEAAFGHALSVEPTRHRGPMVEKGEDNGVHDGRIVEGPCEARPGKVYQRLIDNAGDDGLVSDLRTVMVGGAPALVFIKRREIERRFANANAQVRLVHAEDMFSSAELNRLGAFARHIGMDWGGLDVLRDRASGALYVVDANKTDMGPPNALALAEKLRAAEILADAFRQRVLGGPREP